MTSKRPSTRSAASKKPSARRPRKAPARKTRAKAPARRKKAATPARRRRAATHARSHERVERVHGPSRPSGLEVMSLGQLLRGDGASHPARQWPASPAGLDALARELSIEPSPRFRRFVVEHEADPIHGKFLSRIPGFTSETRVEVFFVPLSLELLYDREVPLSQNAGVLPLALISEVGDPEEAELDFLAVKADDEKCPVLVWNHETGMFEPFAETLDGFIASLEQGD
jgi:hypothetical protein